MVALDSQKHPPVTATHVGTRHLKTPSTKRRYSPNRPNRGFAENQNYHITPLSTILNLTDAAAIAKMRDWVIYIVTLGETS